jgi:hypothetical protein
MQSTYIQTVYLPQENIFFIEDWLKYHLYIGIDHFFLYDNTGSKFIHDPIRQNLSEHSVNKYGQKINISLDEALEKENKIFKNYPVTKIEWKPVHDGKITYGQIEACIDFAAKVKEGLCAFIDIDEFIVKKEEFYESRILQKKYDDRWKYSSIFDCSKTFDIDTKKWSSKVILDLSAFSPGENIHFENKDLPISKSWFNHYNHNEVNHKWLLKNYKNIDPSWKPVPYEHVFNKLEKLEMPKL